MGIGSFIHRVFRRAEPHSMEDDELGLIDYERGRWWTAKVTFDGVEAPVATLLRGGKKGIDPRAREALRVLHAKLRGLLDGPIVSQLRDAERDRTSNANAAEPPKDIFDVYVLTSMSIETIGGKPHVEIGFTPTWSSSHHVWFHFDDWEPTGVSVHS